MAYLNLGQDVANKREINIIDSFSYSNQILSPRKKLLECFVMVLLVTLTLLLKDKKVSGLDSSNYIFHLITVMYF